MHRPIFGLLQRWRAPFEFCVTIELENRALNLYPPNVVTVAGYENLIQIHESDNSLVYRARRVENKQSVILKFLNQEYPTVEQIRRYKQEYHLTCQLDSPRIAKAYSLQEWQRSFVIVFYDFGGISLKQWLKEREKLTLEEFLFLAIAAVESLEQIHAVNIIHKDINPANIVFNPETKELKIIDFGIATQLSRENPTLKNPNVLEGTLAYISPEKTGRMNRSLDYRTDFYSLGVTFYELLTGQLPFTAEEPLELVHCHIAKKPRSPSEIDPSIPSVVSEIILKLMAKNAEDRYQSTSGIQSDLVVCLMQLEASLPIEEIVVGENDISSQFQIPQKLYGREEEIATLLSAFDRVAAGGKDAVKGAIAMLEELKTYNLYRQEDNLLPLRIGIGLHSGRLMLGTVGGMGRMDGTVIGDAVNLSSRVEGLTKTYGVSLLITHQNLRKRHTNRR